MIDPVSSPDLSKLTPADPEDIKQALSYALRFNGRRAVRDAAKMAADIAADRLVEHLRMSGFVIMKGPPSRDPWPGAEST